MLIELYRDHCPQLIKGQGRYVFFGIHGVSAEHRERAAFYLFLDGIYRWPAPGAKMSLASGVLTRGGCNGCLSRMSSRSSEYRIGFWTDPEMPRSFRSYISE